MGYVIAAALLAMSCRSPRALLGIIVTLLVGLYIYAQMEIHRVRVKVEQQERLEQQEKQDTHPRAATARRAHGKE